MANVYQGSWAKQVSSWHADVPPETLQLAVVTHAEMAGDRYYQQLATVLDSVADARDPHWTAVTCYYAAFYGAQALLLASGRGAVKIDKAAGLPFGGVMSVSFGPSTASVGQTTVALQNVGASSHRATWKQLLDLLDDLVSVETDARVSLILQTLKQEIEKPEWLSDSRNSINYDLTSSPFAGAKAWSSLLLDVDSTSAVEDELARSLQSRPERRFEVVAMAVGSLLAALRSEHKRRGGRLDRRQIDARASILPTHQWLLYA